MIPGETDKMQIVSEFPKNAVDKTFNLMNSCMIGNGLSATYLLGDEIVLKEIYHLSDADMVAIRKSLD